MGKYRNYDYGMLPITQALYLIKHIFSIVIFLKHWTSNWFVYPIPTNCTLKTFLGIFSFEFKQALCYPNLSKVLYEKPKKMLPCKIQSFYKSYKMGVIVILFLCIWIFCINKREQLRWAIYNGEMVTIILCKY